MNVLQSLDPWKDRTYVEDERKWSKWHLPFTLVFLISIVLYSTYAWVRFATQPEIETFSLQFSREVGSEEIVVLITHSHCNATTVCDRRAPELHQVFGPDSSAFCPGFATSVTVAELFTEYRVPLCYTPDQGLTGDGLSVEFPWIDEDEFFRVSIRSVPMNSQVVTRTEIDVQPWNRKTQVFQVVQKKRKSWGMLDEGDTALESKELVLSNLQYDGRWKGQRGTLRLRLEQFASTFTVARANSPLETFASIGGAASVIITCLGFGLSMFLFCSSKRKKVRPEQDPGGIDDVVAIEVETA